MTEFDPSAKPKTPFAKGAKRPAARRGDEPRRPQPPRKTRKEIVSAWTSEELEAQIRQSLFRMCSAKEQCRAALTGKLKLKFGFHEEWEACASRLLDSMERLGLVDDARYAEVALRSGSGDSLKKKLASIRREGVDRDTLETVQSEMEERGELADDENTLERAWERKFGNRPPASTEKERSKQVRHLMGKGFSYGQIRDFLKRKGAEVDALDSGEE